MCEPTEITEKRCTKCGEVKPVGEFHKDKTQKDGLYRWCKICSKENKKTRHLRKIKKENLRQCEIKKCNNCHNYKKFKSFKKRKTGLFGYNSICKECERQRLKEYRLKNKKQISNKNKIKTEQKQKQKEIEFLIYRIRKTTICSQCKKEKTLINFYRNKESKFTHKKICKHCYDTNGTIKNRREKKEKTEIKYLKDRYLKRLIYGKFEIPFAEIDSQLIADQREKIIYHRQLKQLQS